MGQLCHPKVRSLDLAQGYGPRYQSSKEDRKLCVYTVSDMEQG